MDLQLVLAFKENKGSLREIDQGNKLVKATANQISSSSFFVQLHGHQVIFRPRIIYPNRSFFKVS